MADGFDLAGALARVADGRAACWLFIKGYAAAWSTPLTPADGYRPSELADVEARLGIRLPMAVREAYQLFGRRADLTRTQDLLLEPSQLRFDDTGELLVFRVENQWVCEWGVRVGDVDPIDPPVMFGVHDLTDAGWRPFLDRFSLACVEMVLSESMLCNDVSASRELDDDAVGTLERRFDRLPFPDYPLWANPDGPPVRWFSDGEVLLCDHSRTWLWMHARTIEALDRVRTVLPGDWQMIDYPRMNGRGDRDLGPCISRPGSPTLKLGIGRTGRRRM